MDTETSKEYVESARMGEIAISRDILGGDKKEDIDQAMELAIQADKGDAQALAKLRDRCPGLPSQSSRILNSHLRNRILSSITRESQHFTKWSLKRDVELLEAQLAGPKPAPMESLLAEHAATCFLQLQVANSYGWGESLSEPQWKRIERCQRMLITTLKTLAYVRRIPVSTLMVNVAEMQQVNVMAEQVAEQ